MCDNVRYGRTSNLVVGNSGSQILVIRIARKPAGEGPVTSAEIIWTRRLTVAAIDVCTAIVAPFVVQI